MEKVSFSGSSGRTDREITDVSKINSDYNEFGGMKFYLHLVASIVRFFEKSDIINIAFYFYAIRRDINYLWQKWTIWKPLCSKTKQTSVMACLTFVKI